MGFMDINIIVITITIIITVLITLLLVARLTEMMLYKIAVEGEERDAGILLRALVSLS